MDGWGAFFAAIAKIGAAVLGKEKAPNLPAYNEINVDNEAESAIRANLTNFQDITTLAKASNTFEQSEALRLEDMLAPGMQALREKYINSANTDIDNQYTLPKEMQQAITKFAAEKGVSRGTSGQFDQFSLVKDFGVSLMDWANASRVRGLQTIQSILGTAPRVNAMSPMSMFVTPAMALQTAISNAENQYQATANALGLQAMAKNNNAASQASAGMDGAMGMIESIFGGE